MHVAAEIGQGTTCMRGQQGGRLCRRIWHSHDRTAACCYAPQRRSPHFGVLNCLPHKLICSSEVQRVQGQVVAEQRAMLICPLPHGPLLLPPTLVPFPHGSPTTLTLCLDVDGTRARQRVTVVGPAPSGDERVAAPRAGGKADDCACMASRGGSNSGSNDGSTASMAGAGAAAAGTARASSRPSHRRGWCRARAPPTGPGPPGGSGRSRAWRQLSGSRGRANGEV